MFLKKLNEAAMNGDLEALQQLLQEDPQILTRSDPSRTDTPLHVSALLGHSSFAKQLLKLNPELARRPNSHGSLPLHVASGRGHVGVVRELLAVDSGSCLEARDNDGRTPLHVGAIKGRVAVLAEMVRVRPESGRVVTRDGESALHLCVKCNRLEALKLLVEWVGGDDEIVSWMDCNGNTILHLAVTKKQLEIVRYLLSNTNIDVNARNLKGFTALDVLCRGPRDLRDMEIKQLLQRAGASRIYQTLSDQDQVEAIPIAQPYIRQKTGAIQPVKKRNQTDWLGRKRSTLMVVASLIATVAFQGTLSPPGGFWQDDFTADPAKNGTEKSHHVGLAVMATTLPQAYGQFMIFNTLAFLSSLSIILLLVSGLPMKRRRWMWTQMVIMWIAISALTCTYFIAWIHMTPKDNSSVVNIVIRVSVFLWLCIVGLVFLGNFARMVRWLVRKYKNSKVKEIEASPVNLM